MSENSGYVSVGDNITISGDGYGATAKVTAISANTLVVTGMSGGFLKNEVIIQRSSGGSETLMSDVDTWARCLSTGVVLNFKNLVGEFVVGRTIYGITSGATATISQVQGTILQVELTNPGINYTTAEFTV